MSEYVLPPEAFYPAMSRLPFSLCHRASSLSLKKSLLRLCISIHTTNIIFTVGCIMWCQSFKENNFLAGNTEKTPMSPGLFHLKSTEIRPLTSVGTELDPKTTTARPWRGWFTQIFLIERKNTFPEVVRIRAYKYLNASPCATSSFMSCCPHSVLLIREPFSPQRTYSLW